MPNVVTTYIEPGDTSNPTTDDELLTTMETVVFDSSNLRTGAIALPHFVATRSPVLSDINVPVTTWIDQIQEVTAATSTHGSIVPGTVISPGGTDMELTPPVGFRGTLRAGMVLRWQFTCTVDSVDNTGNTELDRYSIMVEIDGTDDNGAATITPHDTDEIGLVGSWSMAQANVVATAPGAGVNLTTIEQGKIGINGIYIHEEGVFSVGGGNVHIDAIRVRCFVQDALNEVVLKETTLLAMICKG